MGPGKQITLSLFRPVALERPWLTLLLWLAVSCGGSTTATPELPAGGVWRSLTPMPEARQELASAALGGKIFVIAGFDAGGGATNSVFVYDPASNGWSRAASLPIVNDHPGAAVARGTLFAFGGRSPRVFAYDAGRDAWSEVASMSFQHGSTPAVGVLDDRIYVAGGEGGMIGNELESYDPSLDRWTTLASMRVPRNHAAGQFVGSKLYIAGGRPGPTAASALESYDPQTNTWSTLPSMPTGRSGVAAAAVNGRLYVFGGEGTHIYGNVEAFDPAANAWTKLAPMPTPRHGIFGSAIGNSIYLPGGATIPGFAATKAHEVFAAE
jgi:N-acetylneuraminic acid mutarotase